jgi:two-component system, chemotaxis family, CheB/CheR fusion protein
MRKRCGLSRSDEGSLLPLIAASLLLGHIATIFLDRALKIKRFTLLVRPLFSVIPTDVSRPLDDYARMLDHKSLTDDAAEVLRTLQTMERET